MTREKALRIYTENSAHLLRMEDDLGSIEVGKYADLVVLTDDYLTVAEDDIQHLKPVLTLVGGRPVYEAPDLY